MRFIIKYNQILMVLVDILTKLSEARLLEVEGAHWAKKQAANIFTEILPNIKLKTGIIFTMRNKIKRSSPNQKFCKAYKMGGSQYTLTEQTRKIRRHDKGRRTKNIIPSG